jgi:hypothetical protein
MNDVGGDAVAPSPSLSISSGGNNIVSLLTADPRTAAILSRRLAPGSGGNCTVSFWTP